MQGVLGQKLGMTVVFRPDGVQVAVTAVHVGSNTVVGKRTEARDGYNAVILGVGEQRVSRLPQPLVGQYRTAGLVEERDGQEYVKRHVREFRVTAEQLAGYTVGQVVRASDLFKAGEKADVVATSKGRGFTGVMKRYNFAGFKATHGVHEYFRHGGSIGSNTSPARVFKNRKMPGQHGNARVSLQNVQVIEILDDEGIVLVKGGVPGPRGGLVQLKHAVKIRR